MLAWGHFDTMVTEHENKSDILNGAFEFCVLFYFSYKRHHCKRMWNTKLKKMKYNNKTFIACSKWQKNIQRLLSWASMNGFISNFLLYANCPLGSGPNVVVLKVTRDCFGFASLRSVIGPDNLRHSLNQSDAKLKPITTRLPAFPTF